MTLEKRIRRRLHELGLAIRRHPYNSFTLILPHSRQIISRQHTLEDLAAWLGINTSN